MSDVKSHNRKSEALFMPTISLARETEKPATSKGVNGYGSGVSGGGLSFGQSAMRLSPLGKLIFIALLTALSSCNSNLAWAYTDNEIANAIYHAEGGSHTNYPYGIKSVKTDNPRRVCLNTIKNNRIRFTKQTEYTDFIEFLGSRYCPPKAHKLNENWVKNVKAYLRKYEELNK